MFKKVNRRAPLIFGAVLGLFLSNSVMADITVEESNEILTAAKSTVEKFKKDTKGAESLFSNAKGILVCPKITKFGVFLGTEGGECVLITGASEPLFYNSRSLKAGVVVGIQSHSMILVMNTDDAMVNFTSGKREWDFGLDASISVVKLSVGGEIDTTNLKSSISSFIFGEKGLMADLSWEGTSFKKLDVEKPEEK